MRTHLHKLWRSRFIRNVAVLGSGTALAQVLAIGAAPVLTRLYSPHDFGLLAVFTAFITTVAAGGALKYQQAIVLPKDDDIAANILGLCGLIVLLMAVVAEIIVLILGDWLTWVLGAPALSPYLSWIPAAVLAIGFYKVLTFWAVRKAHFRRLSISEIVRSGGVAVLQLLLGLLRAGPIGLIGGSIVGQFGGALILGLQTWHEDRRLILSALSWSEIRRCALHYADFPKFNMPRTILSESTVTMLSILLAMFFSPAAAGAYWLTYRVCRLPSSIIGDAIRRVYYQKAAAQYNQGQSLVASLTKVTAGLLALTILPFGLLILYGPTLYSLVFGSEWTRAGHYAQWLALWWLTQFVCVPSMTLILIYGFQRFLLAAEAIFFLLRVLTIPSAAYLANDVVAVAAYSIMGVLLNAVIMVFVYSHARKDHRSADRISGSSLASERG